MNQPDDEMFDDIHQGVEALRSLTVNATNSLSERATESLERLETAVPRARQRLQVWKQLIAANAAKAVNKTDEAAHRHPWLFIVSALGLGVLTGMVLRGGDEGDGASSLLDQ